MAPTLVTTCTALPPEGVVPPRGGPAAELPPTLIITCTVLPFSLQVRARTFADGAPALTSGPRRQSGFTLIELLVALSIMALMAVLSWRGLDGMARAQAQTSQRADEVLTLQAGLAQWKVDLDSLAQTPQINSLDWDGRVLRLTRRTSAAGEGLVVVAWTRRIDAAGQWLRWQSPVFRTTGGWNDAWNRATTWAQSASVEERTREVVVTPLQDWQIFYFRGDAWTNPLSSDASQATAATARPPAGMAPGAQTAVPEGIRLVLTLPPGQAIYGKLTLDWVRPTLGSEKS